MSIATYQLAQTCAELAFFLIVPVGMSDKVGVAVKLSHAAPFYVKS